MLGLHRAHRQRADQPHIKAKRGSICRLLHYHAHPGLRNLADLMTRLLCARVWFAMCSSVKKHSRTILQVFQLCPSCPVKNAHCIFHHGYTVDGNAKSRVSFSTTCSSDGTFTPSRQLHASQRSVFRCSGAEDTSSCSLGIDRSFPDGRHIARFHLQAWIFD